MPRDLRYTTDARNFKSMSRLSLAFVAIFVVVSALLVNTGSAQAQKFAIAGQIGTTGLGGGVVIGVAPRINFRSMFGVLPTNPTVNIEDIDFATDLPSFLLTTVDLYLTGAIHVSGGGLLVTNSGNVDVVGTFDGVEVDFGGMPFTGGPDDQLLGTFTLRQFQPYVGVGVGNALGQRLSINFDAGVGFGTMPTVELTAEGPLAEDPVTGPAYRAGVEQKETEIEAALPTFLRYYPVFSVSFSFSF